MPRIAKTSALLLLGLIACAQGVVWFQVQQKDLIQAPSTQYKPKPLYVKSHALIVGIDKYPNLPPGAQLNYSGKDADELSRMLKEHYGFEDVTELRDGDATRAGIREALHRLASSGIGPNDRVLIYFSGHGQVIKMPQGYETGFLIPSDAKINLSKTSDAEGFISSCLSMDEFEQEMAQIPAKHVAVIADACFSGRLAISGQDTHDPPSTREISARSAEGYTSLPVHEVLAASTSRQESLEDSKLGHGIFTYYLLDEMKNRAATGRVFSLLDLFYSLNLKVQEATGGKGDPQFPQYAKFNSEGQFLFCGTNKLVAPAGSDSTYQGAKPLKLTPVVQLDNKSPVLSICFSKDQKHLAVSGYDYGLTLYDLDKGKSVPFPAKPNTMMRISPDWAKVFAITIVSDEHGSRARIKFRNASSRQDIGGGWDLPLEPGATIDDIDVSNDGAVLCGTQGRGRDRKGYCIYYRLNDAVAYTLHPDGAGPITQVALSADGSTVAFVEEFNDKNEAHLVYLQTKELMTSSARVHSITLKHGNSCEAIELSANGQNVGVTCTQRNADGSQVVLGTELYTKLGGETRRGPFYQALRITGVDNDATQVIGWTTALGGTYVDLYDGDSVSESLGGPSWPDPLGQMIAQATPEGKISVSRIAR